MKKSFLQSIILIVAMWLTSSFTFPRATDCPEIEDHILVLINKHRNACGKADLVMNEIIRSEARKHSLNMASGDTAIGHEGFGERNYRIHRCIKHSKMAENVAQSFFCAESSVQQWLECEKQRKNLLGNYTKTGIGIARKGYDYYLTEIFVD